MSRSDYYFEPFNTIEETIEKNVVVPTDNIFTNPQKYGIQARDGQYRLALDIAESIKSRSHLMAEAGVGIGKTFAYLIPGMLAAHITHRPLIVATSSIALTKQLMEDVEITKSMINLPYLHAELVKGANNYVCRRRAYECIDQVKTLRRGNSEECKEIDPRLAQVPEQVWRDARKCDERETFNCPVDNWVWRLIQCRQDKCLKSSCTHYIKCEFQRMRRMIGEHGSANIIVANQDVLIANLKNLDRYGSGFIHGNPCLIVVDEGHNFEEKTRSNLTERFTLEQIIKPLESAQKLALNLGFNEDEMVNIDNAILRMRWYFEKMIENVKKSIQKDPEERFKTRFDVLRHTKPHVFLDMADTIESINTAVIARRIKSAKTAQMLDELNVVGELFEKMYEYYNDGNPLFWGEGDITNPDRVELCWAPKDINRVLRRWLFANSNIPVVITSATLCQPGDKVKETYRYQAETLGFRGGFTPSQPSPFDYQANSMLYVAADMPDPKNQRDQHLAAAAERIKELLTYTNGRALILLTSKDDMDFLKAKLDAFKLPWKIFVQKTGEANQDRLKQQFIQSKGVLLSTNYWEGFNVPGPALSQVIIVRLPFPVPDPVMNYKTSKVHDDFEILLPEMLVKLRQGAGRLIRKENDTGLLTILDPRLGSSVNKRYRRDVLASLPIKNYTESTLEAQNFCNEKIKP